MSTFAHRFVESPLGPLHLLASDDGLCALRFPVRAFAAPAAPEEPNPEALERGARHPLLAEAQAQLTAYFAGRLDRFDLPLRPQGTEFQRLTWEALRAIPFGETRSYADVALAIGRRTATRAVGAANGQNPIAIVVPCHRVVGKDGSLTGFGGGLPAKRFLLAHEQRLRLAAGFSLTPPR